MVIKYDVMFYRGWDIPIFLFEMDHEIEYVEHFAVGLFEIHQCEKLKNPNDVSEYCRLEGTFYDCCHRPNNTRVTLSIKYKNVTIASENYKLEFRIDDLDLYKIDFQQYKYKMKLSENFKVKLVFCSSKNKVNKEYYVGYAHVIEVIN